MENLRGVLQVEELALVREIDPARLALLDEDQLLALHKRVRRARNKHTTNYRRQGAEKVGEKSGRGFARPLNTKTVKRAEAFEQALATVSNHLATAAAQSARDIKEARLT